MTALWGFTGSPDALLASRMGSALAHRGSGEPTTDAASQATVAVSGARPVAQLGGIARAEDGELTVAFGGRLPSGQGAADILRGVRRWGTGALRHVPGEWIIVIRSRDRLVIARDAAGARTVYWAQHAGRTVFAVEPKGVLATPGVPRRLDAGAVAQFLTFSFVPGERTALQGLHELEAGHHLTVDLRSGEREVARWFVHEDVEPEDGPPESFVAATRTAIDAAVRERLPDHVPVGAFLSGGLDSSIVAMVAADARRQHGGPPLATFSLHFGAQHPNELEHAACVARAAGTDHHEVEVSGRDLVTRLRRMIWHLDEPIGDPVTIGNFTLAETVAGQTDWVLNGEGGDPVFGGPKNLPMLLSHWYADGSDPRFREAAYLATWRRAGEEVAGLLHPDVLAEVDLERDLDGVIAPYFDAPRPRHFLNKLMVANMRLKGAHLILPKVDRMLGAYGLTPLSPLFDPEVIRLSLRMPPQAKLNHGVEKWVLKQAYADLVPASIIARPKSGMRVPVHWWFQNDLRRVAADVLSPRRVRAAGVFDPQRVKELRRYRTGRDGLRLWMLVTFELWRRFAIEGESL